MASILKEPTVRINLSDQYRKQSYRTRAYILGPHQIEILNVPVKKALNNSPITDIYIDYRENWHQKTWKTIENCYRNAPFFEETGWMIQNVLYSKPEKLLDLNHQLLVIILKIMKIKKEIVYDSFSFFEYRDEFVTFNPKNREEYSQGFVLKEYFQTFGEAFVPNLSIIDLVFSQGPQSINYLI